MQSGKNFSYDTSRYSFKGWLEHRIIILSLICKQPSQQWKIILTYDELPPSFRNLNLGLEDVFLIFQDQKNFIVSDITGTVIIILRTIVNSKTIETPVILKLQPIDSTTSTKNSPIKSMQEDSLNETGRKKSLEKIKIEEGPPEKEISVNQDILGNMIKQEIQKRKEEFLQGKIRIEKNVTEEERLSELEKRMAKKDEQVEDMKRKFQKIAKTLQKFLTKMENIRKEKDNTSTREQIIQEPENNKEQEIFPNDNFLKEMEEWKQKFENKKSQLYKMEKRKFTDNKIYQGEEKNGRFEGFGILFNGNEKYEGEFRNSLKSEKGIYYYSNGDRYEGEWKHNLMNGKGNFYSNGNRFEGLWKNGVKTGKANVYYENGTYEERDYLDGKRHGVWRLRNTNGEVRKRLYEFGKFLGDL